MDKEKSLRIIRIDYYIKEKLYPNCNFLATELDCSIRTILRDIDYLKDIFNAPIKYSKTKNGYYYDREFSVQKLQLTEGDLVAVLIGNSISKMYQNTPFSSVLDKSFDRLSSLLPDYIELGTNEANFFAVDLYSSMKVRVHGIKKMHTIIEAFSASKKIKVEKTALYSKEKLEVIVLCPLKIKFVHGSWFLIGYYYEQEKYRQVNVNHIKKIRILNKKFNKTDLPFCENILVTEDHKEQKIKVKAQFSKKISGYIEESIFESCLSFEKLPKGDIVIEFIAPDIDAAYQWLLSFGSNVYILEPVNLRNRMRKDLIKMVKMY